MWELWTDLHSAVGADELSEADRIARAYDELLTEHAPRWDPGNGGNQAILLERRKLVTLLLDRQGWLPLGERTVLDVGTGGGLELAWLRDLGALSKNVIGVDLLPGRVAVALKAFPDIDFRVANAEQLEFDDSAFDLVMSFTVFSSILDPRMAANVASEIRRVLKPGGGLLWYDFRYDSPSNRHVKGVARQRVRELFPDLAGELSSLTLLPPIARRLGPMTGVLYPALRVARPLRSHLAGLLIKQPSG